MGHSVTIWEGKKAILTHSVSFANETLQSITPRVIESIIKEQVIKTQ